MIYAVIGSRQTPVPVLDMMCMIGTAMVRKDHLLRSGGANGADTAFEIGAKQGGAWASEIYDANDARRNPAWFDHAAQYHPAWGACTPAAKALHARNSAIMLGRKLDRPVHFVVCWTADGRASGGTGQALRIAEVLSIPVFNFYHADAMRRFWEFVR